MVKICLVMIVKNEEKIITRMLDSVRNLIDCAMIVDTGSIDNTISKMEKWFESNHLSYKIEIEHFVNFSFNRTNSLDKAAIIYPDVDYYLLSDADHVWYLKNFNKSLLQADAYYIKQSEKNATLTYECWNCRLLSAKKKWKCVGLTHEYWVCQYPNIISNKLYNVYIDDIADGGSKENKFIRDEFLLTQTINDNKTQENDKIRCKFYLGITYNNMAVKHITIDYYIKALLCYFDRIDCGGFDEEIYISMLNIGSCYENIAVKYHNAALDHKPGILQYDGKHYSDAHELLQQKNFYLDCAYDAYKRSYNYRPTRAEALYSMVILERKRGKYKNAYDLCVLGNKILYPKNDLLLVIPECYSFLFDYEIIICAYYLPSKFNIGFSCAKKLISQPFNIPIHYYLQIVRNFEFYLSK